MCFIPNRQPSGGGRGCGIVNRESRARKNQQIVVYAIETSTRATKGTIAIKRRSSVGAKPSGAKLLTRYNHFRRLTNSPMPTPVSNNIQPATGLSVQKRTTATSRRATASFPSAPPMIMLLAPVKTRDPIVSHELNFRDWTGQRIVSSHTTKLSASWCFLRVRIRPQCGCDTLTREAKPSRTLSNHRLHSRGVRKAGTVSANGNLARSAHHTCRRIVG